MHEIGHVLGLDHARSSETLDGHELMNAVSSNYETVYPSTLDAYGVNGLYAGKYGQTIQLPDSIPYKMLTNGNPPPSAFVPMTWDRLLPYVLIVLGIVILGVVVKIATNAIKFKEATEDRTSLPPRPD